MILSILFDLFNKYYKQREYNPRYRQNEDRGGDGGWYSLPLVLTFTENIFMDDPIILHYIFQLIVADATVKKYQLFLIIGL